MARHSFTSWPSTIGKASERLVSRSSLLLEGTYSALFHPLASESQHGHDLAKLARLAAELYRIRSTSQHSNKSVASVTVLGGSDVKPQRDPDGSGGALVWTHPMVSHVLPPSYVQFTSPPSGALVISSGYPTMALKDFRDFPQSSMGSFIASPRNIRSDALPHALSSTFVAAEAAGSNLDPQVKLRHAAQNS
jgi:hypothetical protein